VGPGFQPAAGLRPGLLMLPRQPGEARPAQAEGRLKACATVLGSTVCSHVAQAFSLCLGTAQ
ncbi:MAG TPA: hypothetical protein VEO53_04695, partial [Candidatus Binatia bacterium]|nr:hypothetical protein [Candidatus Binatia bacterium]